ncbi:hypothetical protein EEB14_48350 [Rhodococcus sp. WS4]|nr:hypothetical protein EEB14_48350 [Rhodococcus sp. WS4]
MDTKHQHRDFKVAPFAARPVRAQRDGSAVADTARSVSPPAARRGERRVRGGPGGVTWLANGITHDIVGVGEDDH